MQVAERAPSGAQRRRYVSARSDTASFAGQYPFVSVGTPRRHPRSRGAQRMPGVLASRVGRFPCYRTESKTPRATSSRCAHRVARAGETSKVSRIPPSASSVNRRECDMNPRRPSRGDADTAVSGAWGATAAALLRLDVRAGPGVSRETRELTHTPSPSPGGSRPVVARQKSPPPAHRTRRAGPG